MKISLIIIVIWIAGVVGYGMNIYKLLQCDFDAPYKAEAIRTVGVFVPPIGAIAGYIDLGK